MIINGRFRSLPPGHYSGLTHTTEPIRVVMTCSECGLDRDSLEFESLSSPCRWCVASPKPNETLVAGGSCPVPVASDARGCPPYRVGHLRTIRTTESGRKSDPNGPQMHLNRTLNAPKQKKEAKNDRISEFRDRTRPVHGGNTDSVGRLEPNKTVIRPSPGPQEALKDSPLTPRGSSHDKELLGCESPGSTTTGCTEQTTREEADRID